MPASFKRRGPRGPEGNKRPGVYSRKYGNWFGQRIQLVDLMFFFALSLSIVSIEYFLHVYLKDSLICTLGILLITGTNFSAFSGY